MTSLDVLAWFTVLLCAVSVVSFGLGVHNMLIEQEKGIETDGSTLFAQTLYTRDIVSDGTFDLGSATLPFDNVWTSNISNKQAVQLVQGSSTSDGDYLLCFNDNDKLIQTTIHASSLDGGPFMPLSGGTMEGDITTSNLVNVGTINSLITSSWITNVEPYIPNTLAIYTDGHIQSSTIDSSSVIQASGEYGRMAYFINETQIGGLGDVTELIQCLEPATNEKLAIWEDSKWIMDSSVNAADVLLETFATTNYVTTADPTFTGVVISNESITSSNPIVYTLFAEPNDPLNLEPTMSTLELTGMSVATPILNTGNYFTYASNTLTYTGPTFRARIQFSATLELPNGQQFIRLQLNKTGTNPQTAVSIWDVYNGFENSQTLVYVTMVTELVSGDAIVLQGETVAVDPLVIFTQTLYTVTSA